MLTRLAIIDEGSTKVTLTYITRDDFEDYVGKMEKTVGPSQTRFEKLGRQQDLADQFEKGVKPLTEEEKQEMAALRKDYGRYKLGKLRKADRRGITDLAEERDVLRAMYQAVLVARAAATAASEAYAGYKTSRVFKSVAEKAMKTYFRGADKELKTIQQTFDAVAQGLNGSLTISDCAGREMGPMGGLAEGIVPLRKGAEVLKLEKSKALEAEISNLHQLEMAQQDLMREFLLDPSNTGSIHVQFSYCKEKPMDAMARIIVHEATHKFAGTADYGYAAMNSIKDVPPEKAVRNADSYAFAAMSVYLEKLVTAADLDKGIPAASGKNLPRL